MRMKWLDVSGLGFQKEMVGRRILGFEGVADCAPCFYGAGFSLACGVGAVRVSDFMALPVGLRGSLDTDWFRWLLEVKG